MGNRKRRKKSSTPRNHRLASVESLEERRMLASDMAVTIDSAEAFRSAILSQAVPNVPGPGEMVFLASGPHPDQIQIKVNDNVDAADSTNADQLQPGGSSGLDLTGAGYTVGVWDGGHVRETHQEFGGRVTTHDSSSLSDHATHVAGTIGAAGVDSDARGMASEVTIRSWSFNNDRTELRADAANLHVSNHSYGSITGWRRDDDFDAPGGPYVTDSGRVDIWYQDYSTSSTEDMDFGRYSSGAAELDDIIYDNPHLLSVWSSGNDRNDAFENSSNENTYVTYFSSDPGGIGWAGGGWYLVGNGGNTAAPPADGNEGDGYDSLSTTKTAKNTLVVGAVHDVTSDPYSSSDIVTSSFSSYGGSDDGRIKPDVVGNGVSLYSPEGGSNSDYGIKSGTSMSTPNVAGGAVLLVEHYDNEFEQTPLAATTKAMLIHTASDAGNPGPDYAYGWGLVNVAEAADLVTDAVQLGSDRSIRELSYGNNPIDQLVTVDGSQPLKVTIAWTDLPGTPVTRSLDDPTAMLVNDLDLLVVGPDGNHYPWTLDIASPADPAVRTTANHVDNVEQVLIDAPIAGDYTIRVDATGTVSNQDFSIIVEGATLAGTEYVVTNATDEMDGDYSADDLSLREAVQLANQHPSNDTISFDPAIFSSSQTITISSELDITSSLSIEGPGADVLTLDGDGDSRLIHVNASAGQVEIFGMTLFDGITGIRNDGDLHVVGIHFDSNETVTNGGAISNAGSLQITNSLFTNNVAGSQGAALNNTPSGEVVILNSTFSGNSADNAAIMNISGVINIHHSTITSNTASSLSGGRTGGVDNNSSGTINISNTIVAGNLRDGVPNDFDSEGIVNSLGHNLIGTGGNDFGAIGDQVGSRTSPLNAGLDDLANNGGPTMTHSLLANSPALDAGASAGADLVNEFRFSEAAGSSIIADNSSAATGHVVSATLGVSGPRGYDDTAAAFDGVDDYVEISAPLSIGNSSHTMEAWVKIPTGSGRGIILGNFVSTSSNNDQANWEVTAAGEVRVYWKEGGLNAIDLRGTSDIRDDAWHHVAVVRDKSDDEFRIYVDGIAESIDNPNSAGTSLNFAGDLAHRIGGDHRTNFASVAFEGMIDQVAIHDRALSDTEILQRAALFDQRGFAYPRNIGGRDIGAVESLNHLVVGATSDSTDGHFGDGDLSLREAIGLGNAFAGHAEVGFDADGVFSVPAEIDLQHGVLAIADMTTINGPGLELLTIDGQQESRLMHIQDGAGKVAISGLTLTGGFFDGDGGALQIDDSDVLLGQVLLTNNRAVDDGGAISTSDDANVMIVGSTLSGNMASDSSGTETNVGGAIINRGLLTIRNSTLHDNSAESGGAIWTNGTLNLENSTVSNNDGGGIRSSSADGNTITNSTITENSVGSGGDGAGISNSNSEVALLNSIVAGNTAGAISANLAGTDFSGDYNLVGSSSSGAAVSGSGNVTTDQPLLGPLADNGGSTMTHELLDGSPAIDAGHPEDNSERTHWFQLNESTGATTIVDSEGTISGSADGSGVAFGEDSPRGTAATFSGGGILLDQPLATDEFSELTIEAWVRVPTDATGRVGAILGNYRSTTTTSYQSNFEIQEDGKLRVFMQLGGIRIDLAATTDLRDGEWHHVALVKQDTLSTLDYDYTLFVDGVGEATDVHVPMSFSDSNNLHWIGSDNRDGGLPFQGAIDELTIHDAALSPEEIARRATPFDQRGDSFDRVTNDRIDIGAFEADPIIAPELDGDFDDDGDYDCQDVDALVAEIVLGSNDFQFDLSEDGVVDGDDLTLWLAEAGAVNNASGGAYLNGDANLDGVVDISDFNVWNANKFTTNSAWCTADFNTDGVVDISDFNVWNANKFTASDAASQTGNASSEEDEPRVASSLVDSESPEESDRQELATLDRNSIRGPVVSPRFVVRETDREAKEQNLLEAVFGEW